MSTAQKIYDQHPGYQAIDVEWRNGDQGYLVSHGALNLLGDWLISNSWLVIEMDGQADEVGGEAFFTPSSKYLDSYTTDQGINVFFRDTATNEIILYEFDQNLQSEVHTLQLEENMVLHTVERFEDGLATLQVFNQPFWEYPDSVILRNYGTELALLNEVIVHDPQIVPQMISYEEGFWVLTGITSIEKGASIEYLRSFLIDDQGEMTLLFEDNTFDYFWTYDQEWNGNDLWVHADDEGYWPTFNAGHHMKHYDFQTGEMTSIENFSADTSWFLTGDLHADGSFWVPGTNPAFFNFDTWGEMISFTDDGNVFDEDTWEGEYTSSTLFTAGLKGVTMTACGNMEGAGQITYPILWMDGYVGIEEKENQAFISPNPVRDVAKINSAHRIDRYTIYNAQGQLVVAGNGIEINLSGQPPGLYLVEYESEIGRGSTRLIKC